MVNKADALDDVFRALASAPRRSIVAGLAGGARTVGELAAPLRMSPPAVSKHLRVLEAAGVISREVDGRVHRITLESGALDPALWWLRNHGARWSHALDRLGTMLEQEEDA